MRARAGGGRRTWWSRALALAGVLVAVGGMWWFAVPSHREEKTAHRIATRYAVPYVHGDQASQYHVIADHLGTVENPGVVFFFDGDYTDRSSSRFTTARSDSDIQALAKTANEHGMLFVFADTPAKKSKDQDLTWWSDAKNNAGYARSLIQHVIGTYSVDSSRIWLDGWSGGSEFVTDQLLAQDTGWMHGGGATLCAGGSVMTADPEQASRQLKNLPITWHEGEKDLPSDDWSVEVSTEQQKKHLPGTVKNSSGKATVGDLTTDEEWSGYGAGVQGYDAYQKAGYEDLAFYSLPDTGHTDYDLAAVLDQDLDRSRQ